MGQREPTIKLGLIMGFLVARNVVNGSLRSKLGSIIGFLVARNLSMGTSDQNWGQLYYFWWPEIWAMGAQGATSRITVV